MIRAEVTAIVVTDSKLFGISGDVGRWARRVEAAFTAHAIEEAPTGAATGRILKSRANAAYPVGSLKEMISGEVNRVGVRHLETTIESGAPYSIFVIKGTKSPIFALSARIPAGEPGAGQFAELGEGRGLYLPASPVYGKSQIRQRVSGQAANNFLGRAFDATARTHSSLRGRSMVG